MANPQGDLLLRLFVPINKIDEEQRLVYGTVAAEVVDNAGEIFDYDGSKPHFEDWSKNAHATSNGLSKGNLRVMHTAKVAGMLTDLDFDDMSKTISCVAKVVDDAEWKMVKAGGYTGFSMGGRYLSKLKKDDGPTRYVAQPVEVSLVDKPCIKTAVFDYVKSDGVVEQRHFDINLLVDTPGPNFEVLDADVAEKADKHALRHGDGKFKEKQVAGVDDHGGSDPSGHGKKDAIAAAIGVQLADPDVIPLFGKADFADPGYQSDGSKRYPVDSEEHIRAAWSYINMPKNAKAYSADDLSKVKSAIISAWKSKIDKDGPPSAKAEKSDIGDEQMIVYTPTNDELLPVAQSLAKAAGAPETSWMEYVIPAGEDLVSTWQMAKADFGLTEEDLVTKSDNFWEKMKAAKAKKDGKKDDGKKDDGKDTAEKAATNEMSQQGKMPASTPADPNSQGKGAASDSGAGKPSGKGVGDHAGTEQTDSQPGTKSGKSPADAKGDAEQGKTADASGKKDKDSKKGNPFAKKADGVPVQAWIADDGTPFLAKADCVTHNDTLSKVTKSPLLAAIEEANTLLKAETVMHDADNKDCECADCKDKAEKADAANVALSEVRDEISAAVTKFAVFRDNELTKGMYTVSRLADLLSCLEGLHCSVCWEEQAEGDGSTLPASLLSGLKSLGQTLVAMATEEVNEMITGSGKMVDDSPIMELAAQTMGLEKADFVAVIGERLAKRDLSAAAAGDPALMQKFESIEAENAVMKAELAEALPLVKAMAADIAAFKAMPRPPAPRTSVVEKGDDGQSLGGGRTPNGKDLLAKFDPSDLADAAIRMAQGAGRYMVMPQGTSR